GQAWLFKRLEQLFAPVTIDALNHPPTDDHDDNLNAPNLIVVTDQYLTYAVQRWPDVVVCSATIQEDRSIQIIPADASGQALAHLLTRQLNAPPDSAIKRMAERMALVNEVSLEITAIHHLESILSIIPNRLTQRFGYYHASVGIIDSDSIEMYEASQRSRAVGLERFRIPLSLKGIVPWVARQGMTYLASDTQHDEVWIPGEGLEASRSELAVPLLYHGKVIGIIDVQSEHVNAFDQDDIAVLQALAGQLAVAIENARLFDENLRQRQIAETLSRIARLAGTFLNVVEVSQTVITELKQLIPFDAALIALFRENRFEVVYETGYGGIDKASVRWLVGESLLLFRVVHQQEPLLIPDTTKDRLWEKVVRRQMTRAWIGVPLLNRGQVIGVLTIANFAPGAYDEAASDLLFAFANQIAGTVDNAQLFQQIEQREGEARALYDITRLLVTFDRETIPVSVLNVLENAIPFDMAGLLLPGEPDQLVIVAKRTLDESMIQVLEERIYRAFNALSHEPINRQLTRKQVDWKGPLPAGELDNQLDNQIGAWLSAPLLVGRHVVGVIELAKVDPAAYSEFDQRTLHTIANTTATAHENARLYRELVGHAANLQQAVDELADADRVKDELVGNVSHELRSPLTLVVGYVELLLSGDLGELNDEQRNSLHIVATKAKMLTRLVSDILSYETTETSAYTLSEVQLVKLGQHAAQDARLTAEKAGIQVRTECDTNVRPVMGDAERITQVLANLLGNALKFTPAGGMITVRVRQQPQTVRVEVSDTGIGIPADKLPRVFERFYQVELKTRRRRGGVGLGLAICKQIIEGHGGVIGVTSEEGQGSTFYFELPAL
ncbi:MAG: GAF domain-containing protein, partial [Anaerolineae bacterium]|nr:GAF domain-containing protein [Anaerolineae bacterium]